MKTNKIMLGIVACLFLAMPFALAETNKTFEVKGGNEYPLLERAIDRIKLAFTSQIERKQELITKIEQRREEHYQFLLAKGKTEQAEAFKERTTGLEKNFEQWKTNKQELIQKIDSKKNNSEGVTSAKMPAPGYENVPEMIVEKNNSSDEKTKSNGG